MTMKIHKTKILHLFLVAALFLHIGVTHHILQDFVLCFGDDGHVEIENISDTKSCNSSDIEYTLLSTPSISADSHGCRDISLDENCSDAEIFISKNETESINISDFASQIINYNQPSFTKCTQINKPLLENNILKYYKTVSLII